MSHQNHPYVVLSCAMSADGYIDDATDRRLLLSNDADFDRVDTERARADAIMVGANTVRRDNPRLLVRSAERQAERTARGLTPSPAKVTITGSGDLDPAGAFFASGGPDIPRLVYATTTAADTARARLADSPAAEVIAAGDPVDMAAVLADLAGRGVGRLMVEGGSTIHTQLLARGLADELQLVVAPFFVGGGVRFVGDGRFPFDSAHRMALAEVVQIGDVALLRYQMDDAGTSSAA
jgi:5-amino-6-(5-phosphoribosylamino)uracil reductase